MNYISMIILNNLIKFEGTGLGTITSGIAKSQVEAREIGYAVATIMGIIGFIVCTYNSKKAMSIVMGVFICVIGITFLANGGIDVIKDLFS